MSSPLLSLAILRVNQKDYGNDYLDSFLPLIARILPKEGDKPIDVDKTTSVFFDNYGLNIPYHAMVSILNRARKKGLVYKNYDKLFPSLEGIKRYDVTSVIAEKQPQYDHLIGGLVSFGADRFNVTMSQSDAENALLSFIKDHELDILFAAEQPSFFKTDGSTRQNKHVVYRFIQEENKSRSENFKFLIDMVLAHAFASAILYDQKDIFTANVKGLHIYLDTRFVLQLRGLEGKEFEQHAEGLVSLLKKSQARLFLFDHTFREISNIINACPDGLRRQDYDPSKASKVLRFMKEHNYAPDDAERIALGITNFIKQHKIEVVDHPDPDVFRDYQIPEEQLFTKFDNAYTPNRPESDEEARKRTIQADVNSIAAIYRLRKGLKGRYLKDAKFIFMSTNHVLARATREFDIEFNGSGFRIPPGVTDYFIGTIVWIHSPIVAERAIEFRLLAECYADIRPDGALLRKYLNEVGKLKEMGKVTDDEYLTLRSHGVAMELLAEKTLCDPDVFTSQTAEDIIEEMRNQLTVEISQKYSEERERHQETRIQLEKAESIQSTIYRRLDKMSDFGASALTGIIILLFVGGIIIQIIPRLFSSFTGLRLFLLVLTLILGALSVLTGFNIKNMRTVLKAFLNRLLLRIFGVASDI